MSARWLPLFLCTAAVTACGEGSFQIELVYPTRDLFYRGLTVELFVSEGAGCAALREVDDAPRLVFDSRAQSPEVGQVAVGPAAFLARVRDIACTVFLEGCAETQIERRVDNTVVIELGEVAGEGCGPAQQCVSARCQTVDGSTGLDREQPDGPGDAGTGDVSADDRGAADGAAPDSGTTDGSAVDRSVADGGAGDAAAADGAAQLDASRPDASALTPIPLVSGGDAQRIAASPLSAGRVYGLFASDRLFRSDDQGASWLECPGIDTTVRAVAASLLEPEGVYLGIWGDLLYSSDGCQTWQSTEFSGWPDHIEPLATGDLIVGTSSALWRRHTGVWSKVAPAAGTYNIDGVAADATGQHLLAAAKGDGVVRSSDFGETWALANTGLTTMNMIDVAIDALDPLHAVACGEGGVFVTRDGAEGWTQTDDQWCYEIALDPGDAAHGLVSANRGLFVSSDGGSSWGASDCRSGNMDLGQVNDIVYDPHTSGRVLVATGRGLFAAAEHGCDWAEIDGDISGWRITGFAADGSTGDVFAGTSSGVLTSHDGWTAHTTGVTRYSLIDALTCDLDDPTVLYAGAPQQLLRSDDRGVSFTEVSGTGVGWIFRALQVKGQRIYAGSDYELRVSTDGGDSWTGGRIAGAFRPVRDLLVLDWAASALAVATDSGVYYTDDDGQTWADRSSGLTDLDVQALGRMPDASLLAGTSGGVFRAADIDGEWSLLGSADCRIADLLVVSSTVVISCLGQGEVRFSSDGGSQWSVLPGSSGLRATSLGIDVNGDLLVGSDGHGLYRAPFPQ